ncbi:MAG: PDDEXK nuclease domain-containing protein [Muribaculaceae bacterium]|nr:PDDEXK nuclease domain-containing protein [Muribaculaceae bacterium]
MESKTDLSKLVYDIREITQRHRCKAAVQLNTMIIDERWEIGKRIVEEEQNGEIRAEYGANMLKSLSARLTLELGKGYSPRALAYYRQLYIYFPDRLILQTRLQNLTWSHIQAILGEKNEKARLWYMDEAARQMWSVKTLERNVGSQYYHRLLASYDKDAISDEMIRLTAKDNVVITPEQYIKSPVVTEFLGIAKDVTYTESDLENALINHLQQFLMELGKGYAFVERQQHIVTDAGDYYIDLVFYNFLLKCFILIDLKTTKITHQDVGQMDMYVRMYDDLKRTDGDNPTIGILLCAETSEDIAKYSMLNGSKQLFASKYLTVLPSEEELRTEIETQKHLFLLQRGEV